MDAGLIAYSIADSSCQVGTQLGGKPRCMQHGFSLPTHVIYAKLGCQITTQDPLTLNAEDNKEIK